MNARVVILVCMDTACKLPCDIACLFSGHACELLWGSCAAMLLCPLLGMPKCELSATRCCGAHAPIE